MAGGDCEVVGCRARWKKPYVEKQRRRGMIKTMGPLIGQPLLTESIAKTPRTKSLLLGLKMARFQWKKPRKAYSDKKR